MPRNTKRIEYIEIKKCIEQLGFILISDESICELPLP
jgi:hypothetical protein